MIWVFSDILVSVGGVETYLDALCARLTQEGRPFRVAACEMASCPVLDELQAAGVQVYRQRRVPGDRWAMRQRFLCRWLCSKLRPGDWVFCIRQPREEIYETLVNGAHRRGARVAASWMRTPDALEIVPRYRRSFCRAVAATDAVISVSRRGVPMYVSEYGYKGHVHVVPLHNRCFFTKPLPMPTGKPWRFVFAGRLEERSKNLTAIINAFNAVARSGVPVALDIHGDGPSLPILRKQVQALSHGAQISIHGKYEHDRDLERIYRDVHCAIYTSLYEGGPCLSLLEAMQAGRFVLASAVGGIPDLYAEHPEAGLLVQSPTSTDIEHGLREVVKMLDRGQIRVCGPRAVYEESYTMERAHEAWCRALGLEPLKCSAGSTSA